jgi:hypothetical protein
MLVKREPRRAAASPAYPLDAVVPFSGISAGVTSTLEGWLNDGFKSFACCRSFIGVWDSCARRERSCAAATRSASALGGRAAELQPTARRESYLKIKANIKHLQKIKLDIFLLKIKYFLEENLSKFRKNIVKKLQNFEN